MARRFRPYNLSQPLLFSTDIREWLPKGHVSIFISDMVESMDLSSFYASYEMGRGRPGYDPRLLLKLLVYGYSKGIRSSRRIEAATHEDVAFRILAGGCHPDHDTIAAFRSRHSAAFSAVFLQVLELCKKAGLLKVEHISIDGTKVKANASRCKSEPYTKLLKTREELEEEIQAILLEADEIDRKEDQKFGKGKRGDELPPELLDKKTRQAAIDRLIAEIESEAHQKQREYPEKKAKMKQEDDEWMAENGRKFERRPPLNPTGKPVEDIILSRRNPTDYDSRIMKSGTSNGHCQGYNCQAAVDVGSQIIVSADVANQPNDCGLSRPLLMQAVENTGQVPSFLSADSGYFSERDIVWIEKQGVDPYIPPRKGDIGKRFVRTSRGTKTLTEEMRDKLMTATGQRIYSKRKSTIEPVFGQVKENRGFRSFLLRGIDKVKAEWQLIATAHNLGKLKVATT